MDPVSLAGTVVGLIAPRLAKAGTSAAREAGGEALDKVDALVDAVRGKLAADPKRAEALEQLEEATSEASAAEQERLRNVLVSEIALDDEFARRLETLVEESGGGSGGFDVRIGGSNSGNVVNIGTGSSVGNITGGGAVPPSQNPQD